MYSLWLAVTLGRRDLAAIGVAGGDLAGKILADGGLLGVATGAIAVCASVSTLIGCYLALSRFNADRCRCPPRRRQTRGGDRASLRHRVAQGTGVVAFL